MTEYKIRIYSAGYVFRYELADYLWLKCEQEVNGIGLLQVDLLASHPALAALEYRGIVELWRRVAEGNLSNPQQGIGWNRESVHLYLGKTISNKGYDVARLYCPGLLWLLSTRVIAWAEGSAGHTVWTDRVDAIGRGLVLQNAGSGATVAAGRLREGAISSLAVESVTAAGESVTWVTGEGDLLAELQSLAAAVNDDFSLSLAAAPFSWLFKWHIAQLGTDRSGSVIFQLELGTMSEPVYLLDQREEKTVCIVAGPELVTGHEYSLAIGSAFTAEHDIEHFINAPACNTEAERLAAGRSVLARRKIKENLSFKVRQMPGVVYGRDYFLGDKVAAKYLDQELTPKVAAVVLEHEKKGTERVEVICRVG